LNRSLVEKEFSHLTATYFNSAYFGPSPGRCKNLIEKALARELDPKFKEYSEWRPIADHIRSLWAKLIKVNNIDVALVDSVSHTINTVANGYLGSPGDIIALPEQEYPSLVLPWLLAKKNYGYDVRLIPGEVIDVDWAKKNLPTKTKVFCLSHVSFNTGRKVDLKPLAQYLKEQEILFVVDASQSLGGIEITTDEIQNIDVLTAAGYKWLLGPYGQGFAYFSQAAQKKIQHKFANWLTSKNQLELLAYNIETLPGACKYDRGQASNPLVNAGVEGALTFLLEFSAKEIQRYNQSLVHFFLEHYPRKKFELITPIDHLANIICLKSTTDAEKMRLTLKEKNIDITVREGNLRFSFHLFNTTRQIESLIKVL